MPLKMKELPTLDRPYEKLKMYGENCLSNAELLAIIIKCGTRDENSIDIANRVLLLSQNIKNIKNIPINDLMKIKGIGEVKAIQLKAICELTNRMSKNNQIAEIKIDKPKDVAELLMEEMRDKKQEIIKTLVLNSKNIILKIKDVAIGDTRTASVSIKQLLSENIKMQAPKIIIVHNHPSGDPTPSKDDLIFTNKVNEACNILGIKLLDHVVIGNNRYESIMSRIRDFEN